MVLYRQNSVMGAASGPVVKKAMVLATKCIWRCAASWDYQVVSVSIQGFAKPSTALRFGQQELKHSRFLKSVRHV